MIDKSLSVGRAFTLFSIFVSELHWLIAKQNARNKIHSRTISQQDTIKSTNIF